MKHILVGTIIMAMIVVGSIGAILGAVAGYQYGYSSNQATPQPAQGYECVCTGSVSQAYPYVPHCVWYLHPLVAVPSSNCGSPMPGGQ